MKFKWSVVQFIVFFRKCFNLFFVSYQQCYIYDIFLCENKFCTKTYIVNNSSCLLVRCTFFMFTLAYIACKTLFLTFLLTQFLLFNVMEVSTAVNRNSLTHDFTLDLLSFGRKENLIRVD